MKRFREKVILYTRKVYLKNSLQDYYSDLAIKRFSELKYITENSKANYFESSISRYNTFIGLLSEELNKYNRYPNSIKDKFINLPEEIETLQKKFDPTTAEWRFLQEAKETTLVFISHF
jgi:hypothetical protein